MGIDGGLEAFAAEYVLGTLEPDERAQADARIADDPAFAALVASWQERLAPLAQNIPPVSPSARLKDALMEQLDRVAPPLQSFASEPSPPARPDTPGLLRLRRQVVRWRIAAGLALAVAGVLLVMWLRAQALNVETGRFVAVLEGEGSGGPAFLVLVDLGKNEVYVKAVRAEPVEANVSYELWALGGGLTKPHSVGVVGGFQRLPVERIGDLTGRSLAETRFAVSREPSGGSPTGQPTGKIPYIGQLIAIAP